MPYKRFDSLFLCSLAARYLHEPRTTYRSVVRHARQQIGYPVQQPAGVQSNDAASEATASGVERHGHQPVVSPSLAWRFIGWLGSLTLSLAKARVMVLKHDPNSLCHRIDGSVDPFKARSEARMTTLTTARQLLLIMPEWESCFGRPFFPQFATRAGFD